jgi:hypothetical protein
MVAYLPCQMYCPRWAEYHDRAQPVEDEILVIGLGIFDPLTFANSAIGDKLYFGFAILSTKIALVFSSMAAANDSGLSSVTNFTPMPYFLKVTDKFRPVALIEMQR